MHEIYFVSHLAVHIDREQTSLFFGEVLYASQKKQKKTKNTVKKKLTLKGHKSFGSDALENLSSCAASTSILWLLIFLDSCDRLHRKEGTAQSLIEQYF